MSNKKCYYAFEDQAGTTLEFQATSLRQAMVMKKKMARDLGIPKEAFDLTSISRKPAPSE
ncbi:hypothetical protein [Cohnella panacarvi]|uniref:hypothetical protein n=1 Tax=Cohnella panacarvi TaxID=400776 RepID=UPI00047E032F|nr:hypothetical protein [Cohnella panacarvi]